MVPASSKKWATAAEWDAHKDLISQLYRDMELEDVMEVMKRDHDFHSTYVTTRSRQDRGASGGGRAWVAG